MGERKQLIWAMIGERLRRKYGWVLREDSIFFSQGAFGSAYEKEPQNKSNGERPGSYPKNSVNKLLHVATD